VWPDDDVLDGLITWLGRVSPLPEPIPMPDGVFLHRRRGTHENDEVRIIVNMTGEEQAVPLSGTWRNILKETTSTDSLLLASRDVAVLVAAQR
jgi:beta-galactosidase GanA